MRTKFPLPTLAALTEEADAWRRARPGALSRREFLSRATALGLAAPAAYGLLGLTAPQAAAQTAPPQGGVLRIQMSVIEQRDPRSYDFPQMYNVLSGLLEPLVETRRDGSFHGVLLESWESNANATEYWLTLRPGVRWNNGDPFTAEDVAANLRGWCDTAVAGNSMASRLASLIDPATGQLGQDAVTVMSATRLHLRLGQPDVTLIPSLADYPAAVMHRDHIGESPLEHQIGTGAYRVTLYEPGRLVRLERNPDHAYWGKAALEAVEFVDLGTDPAAAYRAAKAGEIDMNFDSIGEFVEFFDALGWERSEITTAATIVIRPNQLAEIDGQRPYADPRVRRALALAVDNRVLLELGYADQGLAAANHHVAPIHPDYADIGPAAPDPAQARALMDAAGMMGFEHELISIDDDWRRNTTDVMAAQLRDAGFKVRRTILPAEAYHAGWQSFPFSATDWGARELGVQVLALAYRSDAAWNETGFANAEFDALLAQAMAMADLETRRAIMAKLQQILIDEGVIVQPYWRALYRHARPGILNAERHQKDMLNIHHLALSP